MHSKSETDHILRHVDATAFNAGLKQRDCLVEHIQSGHRQVGFGGRRHEQTHHDLRDAMAKVLESLGQETRTTTESTLELAKFVRKN